MTHNVICWLPNTKKYLYGEVAINQFPEQWTKLCLTLSWPNMFISMFIAVVFITLGFVSLFYFSEPNQSSLNCNVF